MRREDRLRVLALAGALAIAGSAFGATVDVVAHDTQGHALGEVRVALSPTGGQGLLRYSVTARGVTGIDGTLSLPDVPVGTYLLSASNTKDRYLISPSDERFSSPVLITVRDVAERIPVELVYTRGDLVTIQAWLNDHGGGLMLSFREQATRREVKLGLNNLGYGEIVLPPGRWDASVPDPPDGFLLVSLEQDRRPLPGSTALIEVTDGSSITRLTWTYRSTCTVRGVLTCDRPEGCFARILATLEKPGPWLAAAEERGGSDFSHGSAVTDEYGRYEMPLIDGVWRVEAVNPRFTTRSPEFATLDLAPGDERQQDFQVTIELANDQSVLMVEVRSPDDHGVVDAYVAVWPLESAGDSASGGEPLRRARTTGGYWNAVATFRGLPKGSYRIAAGHPEYTEATVDAVDFQGEPGSYLSRRITLGAGAGVRAHAADQTKANVAGVDLVVERIGAPPPSRVAEPELEKKRASRRATTDMSGWAGIAGLDAGAYRVKPVLAGPRAETHIAKIAEGDGALADSLELSLPENGKAELRIALLPAAGIRSQLACSDRGPVPRAVAFRILASPLPFETPYPPDAEIEHLLVLGKTDVPLTGKSLDTLTAGPLGAGVFALAVRPMGHDRWTYQGGTEDITRAIPLTLEDGKIADGGFIDVDCGPTVRVRPALRAQDPLPDLREARVEVKIARVEPSTIPAEERPAARPLPTPVVERTVSRITLRKLPEEKVTLAVAVSDPYFIPETIEIAPVVLSLERGRESVVPVTVPEIGGILEIDAGEASGAVVTDASGKELRADAKDGFVRITSVKAGVHAVRLCADSACSRTLRTWETVTVVPAQITRVR